MEFVVEPTDLLLPLQFSFGYLVKFFFHFGREVVIDHLRERSHEKVVHHKPHISGEELIPVLSVQFRFDRLRYGFPLVVFQQDVFACFARFVAAYYVFAILYGLDSGGIGGWSADAQLLHFTNEAGLRIACRTLREALRCFCMMQRERIAGFDRGQ